MRGKTSNGEWVSPFDPLKISHAGSGGGDYTEANAWQYSWHAMHDIDGLIALFGGRDRFVKKLDTLFQQDPKVYGPGSTVDVSGLIGQYVQGNEPSHHITYLYTYAGQPWKTQEKVAQVKTTLFDNTPNGLSGNDDCGQMSAWYIFSSLGFYPVNPADGKYVFGTPTFKKATINPGTKQFVVKVRNSSSTNIYIQKITFNGIPYYKNYIDYQEIMKGGILEFTMGRHPLEHLN